MKSSPPPQLSFGNQYKTQIRLFAILAIASAALYMLFLDHYSTTAEGKNPSIQLVEALPEMAPPTDSATEATAQRVKKPSPVKPVNMRIGSRIQLDFTTRDYEEILQSPTRLYLYVDGQRVQSDASSMAKDSSLGIPFVDSEMGNVSFHPDKNVLREYFWTPYQQSRLVRITVGNEQGARIPVKGQNVQLKFLSTQMLFMAILMIGLLSFLVAYLVRQTALIRDASPGITAARKPFSFSRTQLTFWFFIITSSLIYVFFITGELTEVSSTTLGLLGISAGTAAFGTAIDQRGKDGGAGSRGIFTVSPETKAFFKDLLSDGQGFSIHRLQAFVFNLFLGLVYIQQVLMNLELPDFDNNVLLLLGLSSGTYASVKALSGSPGDKGQDEPEDEFESQEEFESEEDFGSEEENRSTPTTPVNQSTPPVSSKSQGNEGPELV